MPINIQMPALSPTMEEGTLTKWLIKEGDTVESGDIMAEIETDKATMEFEAVDEGIIGKIIIPEGTTGVKVNEIIAILLEDGEDASSIEIQEDIKLKNNTNDEVNVTNTEIKEIKADVIKSNSSADRVFATPLARRIAKSKDLDLNSISGSGPYGRIVKADVEVSISLPSKKHELEPVPSIHAIPMELPHNARAAASKSCSTNIRASKKIFRIAS